MPHLNTVDIIIVGGGVMGLASAYYAAKQGKTVIVLEQSGDFNSPLNSSYGNERMYRLMYSDPYFAELAQPALDLWKDLEIEYQGTDQSIDKTLLSDCGLLFYGEWSDVDTIEGNLIDAANVMTQRKIPFEHLDHQGLAHRFPVLQNIPDQFEGLFEGGSGFVYSQRACQAFYEGAKQQGVIFKTNTFVNEIQAEAESVSILTKSGIRYQAKRAILCPGAWVNDLLIPNFKLELDIKLWHMEWALYQVDKAWEKEYPEWFCFNSLFSHENNPKDGDLYYGFPSLQDGRSCIKVGIDWTDRISTSMDTFDYTPSEPLQAMLERFIRTQFKGIGKRLHAACSPYAMSTDARFVLDTLPKHPNIALFTAGSGQAFKFAPLIGKSLVELVCTGKTDIDIQPLNLARTLISS
jgi:sarcosine oxidase